MAFAANSLSPLLPLSASRQKFKRPKNPPTINPLNPNPSLKSRRTSSGGEEATTYTRLPPKGDFPFNPSLRSSPLVSGEIKLLDSAANLSNNNSLGRDAEGRKNPKDSIFIKDYPEEEEEEEEELLERESNGDENRSGMGFTFANDFSDTGAESEEYDPPEIKEKGVPAVMRCFDRAKIYVKAGDGGNGVVAFRREKFVPYGGPSGGDGGRGGNVYLEVDQSMNSLLPFRKTVHFRAGRGCHGQGRMQVGAKGEDVVVKVAPGTLVREACQGGLEGEVLMELVRPGERALLLPGGRGGRGNAAFKSGMNKVPKIAENGEKGAEM